LSLDKSYIIKLVQDGYSSMLLNFR